jgi:UDP-4-amino-4,6-dideoxy-N-acetyl-beta-L-altrosamine transaminase
VFNIPYGRQSIEEEDLAAVCAVLRSDWLTQGPMGPRFECALAKKCGAHHAVAVNSATSALHIACIALGLGPGDWLWTSPNTFVASANCALYCGAHVDFVDIDNISYNMSVDALASKLEAAERSGRLPKIVIPVHFAGQSCDMASIYKLAKRYRFHVIEDASHAIGGSYQGEPIGCCRYSDIAVFSFHPVKIITSGEGGAALTNDPGLAAKMALLRSHGITRELSELEATPEGPWVYEQIALGFNYRLTDIAAALGLSQLARLDRYVCRRQELAARYDQLLKDLPVAPPGRSDEAYSAFHLYVIKLEERSSVPSRRAVYDALRAVGIGVNVHYIPVHTQPIYRGLGFKRGDFPEAERYYRGALTLPLYPGMSERDQDNVLQALKAALV